MLYNIYNIYDVSKTVFIRGKQLGCSNTLPNTNLNQLKSEYL